MAATYVPSEMAKRRARDMLSSMICLDNGTHRGGMRRGRRREREMRRKMKTRGENEQVGVAINGHDCFNEMMKQAAGLGGGLWGEEAGTYPYLSLSRSSAAKRRTIRMADIRSAATFTPPIDR